jgi:hypothetical protein
VVDDVEGGWVAVGQHDAVPMPLQAAAQHVPVEFLVVGDEQRGRGKGVGSHGPVGAVP